MRKFILLATALTLSFGLAGCGGGGGSGSVGLSSSSGGGAPSTAETKSVNGGVYSSYVVNAEVCLEDPAGNIMTDSNGNQLCSTTRSDGVFQLQLPAGFSLSDDDVVGLYVKTSDGSTVKIAEAPVSQLEVNGTTNTLAITPLSIAGNDSKLANTIGALIHALGGDTTGDADVVDMGNVEITGVESVNQNGETQPLLLNGSTSLENLLKKKKQLILHVYQKQMGQTYQVTVNPDNATAPVSVNLNGTLNRVAYNCQAHREEIEEHLKALEALSSGNTSEYLQAKTVALLLSLQKFLKHLLNSQSVSDTDKQTVQELVNSAISSLISSIDKNGLNQDTLSSIKGLVSLLKTLASDLESANFRPPMFTVHLRKTVALLESIEESAESALSSQNQQTTAENSNTSSSETAQGSGQSSSQQQAGQGTSTSTGTSNASSSSENASGAPSSTAQASTGGTNSATGS